MKTVAALTVLLLHSGCTDQGLPPDDSLKPAARVEFLEASCTEAWLRLAPRNVSPPYTLTLLRNDSAVATLSSPPTDTTVIDEGLVPSRSYTYRARLISPSGLNLTGNPVQARTLDTTSHQFTWETTVLGDGGSSIFYDVAIVNDTLAYAVGEVYLRDSSGVLDPKRYNMARWNGATWRVQRVPYNYQGQNFYHPIQTVIAFGPDDIWFAGNGVLRWDGRQFLPMPVPSEVWGPYRVNRMWGASARDVYIVGDGGSIAHFDGSTWRRVESGTTLDVYDIFGSRSPVSGETEILAVASDVFQNRGARILRIEGGRVVEMPGTGLTWGVNALWFSTGRRYYVVGPGIHQKRMLSDSTWSVYPPGAVTRYSSDGVRGQAINDVFVVGSFGEIVHFNGISWMRYFSDVPLPSGALGEVAIRNNLVMATGRVNGSRGIILIGRR